jgi:hypothetical protein
VPAKDQESVGSNPAPPNQLTELEDNIIDV